MAQHFKEKAFLKTDRIAYAEGWERIFGKKEENEDTRTCECENHQYQVCDICQNVTGNEKDKE